MNNKNNSRCTYLRFCVPQCLIGGQQIRPKYAALFNIQNIVMLDGRIYEIFLEILPTLYISSNKMCILQTSLLFYTHTHTHTHTHICATVQSIRNSHVTFRWHPAAGVRSRVRRSCQWFSNATRWTQGHLQNTARETNQIIGYFHYNHYTTQALFYVTTQHQYLTLTVSRDGSCSTRRYSNLPWVGVHTVISTHCSRYSIRL